jgi:pyrroline-5-carboxylate reductase
MSAFELGFIGAGNMAEGILASIVEKGVVPAERVMVSDVHTGQLKLFSDQFDVATTADNVELVSKCSTVILSVKPQTFAEVAGPIAEAVTEDHLLISIMAGMGTGKITKALGGGKKRVVRAMPNLPVRVGAGIAGVCGGRFATADDVKRARHLLDAGGSTVLIKDEALIDAVTAVSGSGPAYFYYFVDAIVEGGVACGLDEADALKLAEFTCLGAARMMLETGEAPADLRQKVTSKGGTTQAALEHMERAGVKNAISQAVQAAFRRGRELGS